MLDGRGDGWPWTSWPEPWTASWLSEDGAIVQHASYDHFASGDTPDGKGGGWIWSRWNGGLLDVEHTYADSL